MIASSPEFSPLLPAASSSSSSSSTWNDEFASSRLVDRVKSEEVCVHSCTVVVALSTADEGRDGNIQEIYRQLCFKSYDFLTKKNYLILIAIKISD